MYLHLLVGRDGAEDDLREALSGKHPETDAANDPAIFDEGERLVLPVEVGDVRLANGHLMACDVRTSTHGSNTSRVMYSLGMRGN